MKEWKRQALSTTAVKMERPVTLTGTAKLLADLCGQSQHSDSGFRRVRLKQNLKFEGWNSHVHKELPGDVESTNLRRDNLSGEIGPTSPVAAAASREKGGRLTLPVNCSI